MAVFEDQVLGLVGRDDYKPLTLKGFARRLEVDPENYGALRSAVKRLVQEGRLELAKDKTLRKPSAPKGTVLGTFKRNPKGFGFVRPVNATEKSDAIFIPENAGRDASSGDEVIVKITKRAKRRGESHEGRIIQVVSRASGQFVGTYFERGGAGYVKVDGTAFSTPIFVGDPGAKGAKPADKVTLELVRYPSPTHDGEGVITEVLGPRGEAGVDTLTVIRAFSIPDTFDDDVLEESRQQAKLFSEDEVAGRLDLRETLTITIDPATARDFDDAISLSRDDRGFWSLGVHIADVAHFVKPGSELDRTARLRGTSVYLPDRVIPMLPEVISNSLASLQAKHTRYTMSAFIEFNGEGIRTDFSFARSAIRVDQRFSYEQAFAVMTNPEGPHEGVSREVVALLGRMLELARILRKRRFERGALELSMPEVEIDLGGQGEVVGAHLASTDESHSVIEEFMLAANEAVATFLTTKNVGFLRRAHPDPEASKLLEFAEFARSLGFPIQQALSRFELQRVLRDAAEKPEAYAIHYGFLRSLKQALYTPEPEGHYALASEKYCHFTSPIRRYPDLQVHRQLAAVLEGKTPKSDHDELTVLAQHCTKTARRAEAAEREIIKIKLLTFLETQVGKTFHAVIVGVEDFGLFCRLVELPAEGLIHVRTLSEDYYYVESGTHTLIGRRSGKRYRLGDKVAVTIARVDIDRRELDLAFATSETPVSDDPFTASADDPEVNLPPSRTRRPITPPLPPKPPKLSPTQARKVRGAASSKRVARGKGKKKRK